MAKNSNRDEFTSITKRKLERQAGGHCSNPACRQLTSGATSDGKDVINIGEAAHIHAAARLGPRYDEEMTVNERRGAENGIWLCKKCARAVDSKDPKFTDSHLREWKERTNSESWRSIMHNLPFAPVTQSPTPDELRDRLRAAASADLAVFRNTAKWPSTAVPLTLKVDRVDEALSTKSLANAVTTFDDLILVAAPGMGKTTTIFQVAEGVLETGNGIPFIVLLGEWATDHDALLNSVLKRPAFAGVSEAEFRMVAAQPGIVLLLDGWNELDIAARERARVQISNLKAELPELGFVISTRKQALDIPFSGTRVDLLPLGDEQQLAIARAMRGEAGENLVDQAWRTAGIHELVTIPLYLTTLLSLPEDTPFPTTKEEVLRRFVAAQEQEAGHAPALRNATGGFHQDYLDRLAVFATTTANTSVTDSNARRTVSETTQMLVDDGQLTYVTTQPNALLDTLVNHHVLMRSGDTPGYAFQHQQFQEWYASYEVERLFVRAVSDPASRERLKSDMLNQRPWTEAILFAVERSARGDPAQKAGCGAAILAAFEVDPILAADMIFRATDDVWTPIGATILDLVNRWHAPGKVDRAVRFMITSGRPEFVDLLWPLLTHEDDQVHLAAFRSASRFRPSVLGRDAAHRVAGLPPEIRRNVLHEIASNSGIDGLDVATAIAKKDNDPEVKALVADALSFRRAARHVIDLLSSADDATFDILAQKSHIDDIANEEVRERLAAARERVRSGEQKPRDRLVAFLSATDKEGLASEVTDLVAEMDIDRKDNGEQHLLYEVRRQYPQAVADGLLRRVRENRDLLYGTDNVLAVARILLDDEALLGIALQDTKPYDERADAASSILGPQMVGKLLDAYFAAHTRLRNAHGTYDKAASDRFSALRERISHTPGPSLVSAVEARADSATVEEIAELAELLSRSTIGDDDRARPFNVENLATIGTLAQKWGERLLTTENATGSQKSSIAKLISGAPTVTLLPILQQLLNDNLRRHHNFHVAAKASGWRDRTAMREAQDLQPHEYQRAFIAINAPETDAMMNRYLTSEHFGESAARVLSAHWSNANTPKDERKSPGRVDFSGIEARRVARAANPREGCAEAEMIFSAIDRLLADGVTDEQKKLALTLGIIGTQLPHGERATTIDKLVALTPRESRARLLLSLILSGEDIDIKLVEEGIAETFEAAKTATWILRHGEAYQLQDWLRLLPFANPLTELPTIVRALPDAQRDPHMLEEMVRGLENAPADAAEEVLFKLAEDDPRFYQDHQWRSTVLKLGTPSCARRLIDLMVSGTLSGKSADDWHWRRGLAGLISEHAEVRAHVRELLKDGPTNGALTLLADTIAQHPRADDLVMLVECEIQSGRSFLNWRSIQDAITEQIPSKDWQGAYDVVPVPAIELRRKLLMLTKSGGRNDPAARCLTTIDKMRDESGAPETEPRHPDLASGRKWPILTPDPDVDDGK
ncbi:NACHT domain-containing NTPase [Neorhizobium sp. T7_12]|uniref:NACHT domain-containing protein n=1 Tax=Neorhizobium sp. T7_12 TaxID=2093832 RepID=UPI000CF8A43E|nr:hypothetical protein [Neorhizobium sp. T7_12]